ncbi:Na+/H+ antiporter NhaA [Mucilaginibacter sp. P4]|uniref:Na+/H+ antiporter NhaA n=1 Tax=Mucilaginibacter sp. P4 TaxID=3383180 RepID=UPI0011EBA48E|nr:Na+/H+ antiporter NhaA [Mucilaginibacter gossypii]QEM19025.1 Na+/H+ antiporter NhaA [Mucilaginibacter gossypii]
MKRILLKAINPLRILINDSRFTGLMLIACTVLSMCLANSGFATAYKQFWHGDLVTLSSIPLPRTF